MISDSLNRPRLPILHKTYMRRGEYWYVFIAGYDIATSVNGDVIPTFYPGDRIEIINLDSKHGLFPFGKNYGRIKKIITDEAEGITSGHTAILYRMNGLLYLFTGVLIGTLGLCALLSFLGAI